jgi:PAS domain S-box-containing protein
VSEVQSVLRLWSAARRHWKAGAIFLLACGLIALVWLVTLDHIAQNRQAALDAFAARSRVALQQTVLIMRLLLWDEIERVLPDDAKAFVAARAKQVLATTQALTDAQVWVYCSVCQATEPADPPLFMTDSEGISQYIDASGIPMLTAWSTLRLSDQTWQVGLALPSHFVLAQTDLHTQGALALALLSSTLIFGAALLGFVVQRRQRTILRSLRASQTQAKEQQLFTEALSDIGLALTSALDLDEVMARILSNVGRVVPYSRVSIRVLDHDTYRLAYGRFLDDKVGYVERHALSPELREIFDEMVRTRQLRLIADTETDPRWIPSERQAWIKSYVGVPITVQDQVIGILNLSSDKRNHFTPQHAERLRVFAVQAGVALQNARLYAESRRHAAELERRVQERTLQLTQRSALFEAIVENMTDGLAYFDLRTQRTLYVNSAFVRMSGCSREELLDQPLEVFSRFFRDPEFFEQARARLREANRARKAWQTEFEAVRADGSTFTCMLVAIIVRNAQDEPIGQLNLVRDITSERALQKQRERFITNASHELRTPVTNLKLRLYLAQRDPLNRQKHFQVMEQMVNHLTRLVESLLDLPRFEQGTLTIRPETVNLCDLLRTAVDMHQPRAAERQIALTLHLPDQCISANVDPMRLTQVIDNLVTNALNYTPSGGSVRVQLGLQRHSNINIARLSVSDTGIGIAPEALMHIFEPFYRAQGVQNVRGTGLGLTIAKQIVELHGGTLTVESQEGVGSTFTVHLPVLNPENGQSC